VRLFLAINLEPEVRRAIVEVTQPLRNAAPTVKWVDESRLHLTLKFLGEQPDDVVAALTDSMTEMARGHRRFGMRMRGYGAFPNFRRARVVWLGVEQDARLELLHHDVEVSCQTLGFELEGRAFRPHVTLGRVSERMDEPVLRQLARASRKIDFDEEVVVESLDLMRSELHATGSRYERVHVAPLRSH
jgi:2'-5' RNA ligase